LADAAEILGDRPAALARELTKIHEEFIRASLPELASIAAERDLKGEITLCVGGARRSTTGMREGAAAELDFAGLEQRFSALLEQGLERNEALKQIVRETGLPRSQLYRALIVGDKD
jgi:16S rRNA (cytidine1402-2'-O)-methyltransferase